MRHINRVSSYFWQKHKGPRMSPYIPLHFRIMKKDRNWAKILLFIANNPGCKRRDILIGINAKHVTRGQHSTVFANLLYKDFIDYHNGFRYYITLAGCDMLEKLGYERKMVWM